MCRYLPKMNDAVWLRVEGWTHSWPEWWKELRQRVGTRKSIPARVAGPAPTPRGTYLVVVDHWEVPAHGYFTVEVGPSVLYPRNPRCRWWCDDQH